MDDIILQWLITQMETEWPGTKPYIDFASRYISAKQLIALLFRAITDFQAGMNLLDILRDLVQPQLPVGVKFPKTLAECHKP